jgi:hypothetical protein
VIVPATVVTPPVRMVPLTPSRVTTAALAPVGTASIARAAAARQNTLFFTIASSQ